MNFPSFSGSIWLNWVQSNPTSHSNEFFHSLIFFALWQRWNFNENFTLVQHIIYCWKKLSHFLNGNGSFTVWVKWHILRIKKEMISDNWWGWRTICHVYSNNVSIRSKTKIFSCFCFLSVTVICHCCQSKLVDKHWYVLRNKTLHALVEQRHQRNIS